jgi:hypothetical protein
MLVSENLKSISTLAATPEFEAVGLLRFCIKTLDVRSNMPVEGMARSVHMGSSVQARSVQRISRRLVVERDHTWRLCLRTCFRGSKQAVRSIIPTIHRAEELAVRYHFRAFRRLQAEYQFD